MFISLQWPLVAVYLIRRQNFKRIKRILFCALLCYIITAITTYVGSILFPGVARHMSNGRFADENSDLMTLYYSYNIGTFTFIYSLVIIFPLLIYIYRKYTNGVKFISLLSIISIIIVIVKTEYTTAILMTISSFLLFILPKKFNASQLWRMLILTLCVMITFIPLLTGIMEILSDTIGSDQVSERLLAISELRESKSFDDSND